MKSRQYQHYICEKFLKLLHVESTCRCTCRSYRSSLSWLQLILTWINTSSNHWLACKYRNDQEGGFPQSKWQRSGVKYHRISQGFRRNTSTNTLVFFITGIVPLMPFSSSSIFWFVNFLKLHICFGLVPKLRYFGLFPNFFEFFGSSLNLHWCVVFLGKKKRGSSQVPQVQNPKRYAFLFVFWFSLKKLCGSVVVEWFKALDWRCTNILWQDINLHLLLSTQVLNGYPAVGCGRHCLSNSFLSIK